VSREPDGGGRIPPGLSAALRALRQVRSEKPGAEPGPEAYAAWRVRIAEALESLAPLLLFAEDRQRAEAARVK
jgi:hypothetical protein